MSKGWVANEDCFGKRGMPRLRPNSVDHVVTDPPYDEECHDGRRMVGNAHKDPTKRMKLSFSKMGARERQQAAFHFVRLSRGWVIVFCQDEAVHLWRTALIEAGAKWRRLCIWYKTSPMPHITADRPGQGHEPFVAVWAGEGKSVWNGGGRSNVFAYPPVSNQFHPTQKPLPLMRDIILSFARPREVVLDPYAGGGSTLVAAKEMDRRFIGFEADELYYQTIEERLAKTYVRTSFEQRALNRQLRSSAYSSSGPANEDCDSLFEGD